MARTRIGKIDLYDEEDADDVVGLLADEPDVEDEADDDYESAFDEDVPLKAVGDTPPATKPHKSSTKKEKAMSTTVTKSPEVVKAPKPSHKTPTPKPKPTKQSAPANNSKPPKGLKSDGYPFKPKGVIGAAFRMAADKKGALIEDIKNHARKHNSSYGWLLGVLRAGARGTRPKITWSVTEKAGRMHVSNIQVGS